MGVVEIFTNLSTPCARLIFDTCYSGWSEVILTCNSRRKHYGRIKHIIKKHIDWATIWYINQDHSMNVCKDVIKRDLKMAARSSLPQGKLHIIGFDKTATKEKW